jgi:colanic acid/amylovoran biosynthesis protein
MTRPQQASTGVSLFGAPLDTGNLGVTALGLATLTAIARRHPSAVTTVFDNGRGLRHSLVPVDGRPVRVSHRGAWISRRLHRSESLWTMAGDSRLPEPVTPGVRTIDRAALVLDVSGGDSFTDLYGRRRLQLVALPKEVALRRGRPLVLLPQTYGPFRETANAGRARAIVAGAEQAWARDEESFERLADLLGSQFDRNRHRHGVDVAFALPALEPSRPLRGLEGWLADSESVVGVNVSGLLANEPATARDRFGLRADYREATAKLVQRLLTRAGQRVLLVAHTRGSAAESDDHACAALAAELDAGDRVRVIPAGLGAPQLKWVIAQLDWFCGARMHATIAALSSRVPTAAIAYSDKVRGVFASCGVEDAVVDARHLRTDEVVERLWEQWGRRGVVAERLDAVVPHVVLRADQQFDAILAPLTAATPTLEVG